MSVQARLTQKFPSAIIEEKPDRLIVKIDSDIFREMAEFLYKEDLHFDYMRNLTGIDFGEEGFGVIYHLESTANKYQVELRAVISNREQPYIHTVADLWKIASVYEREAYDFYGIIFLNHPDMRRLFLRNEWKGYPLRKDYEHIDELDMTNEGNEDFTVSWSLNDEGKLVPNQRVLFEPDEYVVNIGPQHPATHGVLRFRTSLDGEFINKIDIHCGYIHRGIEKLCEGLTYQQTIGYMDRLDYLAALQSRHALCMCVEKAIDLQVSDRVLYIRTIMDELQRINSHLLFFSTLCMDLGALTAFFYGFRDREKVLDILEETTGGRLILHYNIIGGVENDIHPDFVRKVKELLEYLPKVLVEYKKVFTDNVIARNRMIGVGVLTHEDAISFGATGPVGRASNWACDVRKRIPYGVYDQVDFKEVVRPEGDSYARYLVRMEEIEESMRIIAALIDNIPEGTTREKTKPIIRIPEGSYYASVEASRGEFGVFIESKGDKNPYRMKFRSTGLPLVACVDTIARGAKIADLIAIGGTLDYVVPDIDR
ncbi:NADH-quinone oxidoreductase subunit D [Bacteroides sp.]|uniref:NADH-quinone oxidoreductase subunit D n=1 Tax=Bacteroides sp. TaxID=29523 RepID=UPI002585511D|nr:NADH-quinone oxidoreductase subunit D [Bacteroides sp.]